MISHRRGVTRAAEVAVVALFAALALVLIIYKLKENKGGVGVPAVPLNAPVSRPVAAADAKPAAAGGVDRDMEIQVVDAASKQPIAGALLSIDMDGRQGRMDR